MKCDLDKQGVLFWGLSFFIQGCSLIVLIFGRYIENWIVQKKIKSKLFVQIL